MTNQAGIADSNYVRVELENSIARYREKTFDMDAFPSNRGYPLLERGQMRFIGSGGSPKVGDTGSFPPDHFTISLIHQEPGRYAAAHSHEVKESFLVFDGVLTVGWEQNGEVIEVRLAPKDMIMNIAHVAHGFRNDDKQDVLMSVMVQRGKPFPPVYKAHPRDVDNETALRLGALPSRVLRLDTTSDHPLMRQMTQNLIRYSEAKRIKDDAGFSRHIYVGPGGIPSEETRAELITLAPNHGVRAYARDVEDAYFVMEGELTVGRENDGEIAETRIQRRDVALNQPGTYHYFRNESPKIVQFMLVIGSPEPDNFRHVAR
jgi:quercetin dioxygenase-like cupin family protein